MTKIQIAIKSRIPETTIKIKEINLIQQEIINPADNYVYKLHKRKKRFIKHASLNNSERSLYHYGQYKYTDPIRKKVKYYTQPIPNVTGKRRHDNNTIIKVITPALKSQMPYSAAAEQGRNLLNLDCVPSTIHKWISAIEINEDSFKQIQEKVKEVFSGHVSIDEVHDQEGTIISTDPVSDTILNITTHKEDIINEDVKNHLKDLKDGGITPKTVSKDGSQLYVNTIQKIFESILLQLCIFHLLMNISKEFFKWMKRIRDKIQIPKLKRGKKKKADDNGERGNAPKSLKQDLFRSRYIFLKKRIKGDERKKVKKFYDLFPELRELRICVLMLRRIFQTDLLSEAEKRYQNFIVNPIVQKQLPNAIKKLKRAYERDELFTYLRFEKNIQTKIRTTNHTERTNRKFRKKQKTHYRIRKYENKVKMLKLMQYFYNWRSLYKENSILIECVVNFFIRLKIFRRSGILVKKLDKYEKELNKYQIPLIIYYIIRGIWYLIGNSDNKS